MSLSNNIILINNSKRENEFTDLISSLYQKMKSDKSPVYVCVDFEFNTNWKDKTKYISLIQLVFIDNVDKYFNDDKMVYILDPYLLGKSNLNKLIEYVFCSNMIKIFHGSDSIDCPQILTELFNNNSDLFIKFINNLVDTRFLCEISKRLLSRSGSSNIIQNKCSIYNALYDHHIIDEKLFTQIDKISSKINYNKNWNIKNLTNDQLQYSVNDVAYMFDLFYHITNSIIPNNNNNNNDNNDLISYINRIYRYYILNKLNIIDISDVSHKLLSEHKIKKDNVIQNDQMIMDTPLMNIKFIDLTEKEHNIEIYFEDILSIDTLRKKLLQLLRPFQLNISEEDQSHIKNLLNNNKYFTLMKGSNTIIHLVELIQKKNDIDKQNIKCVKMT